MTKSSEQERARDFKEENNEEHSGLRCL